VSKANRRAVGFGFVVTGILLLLVKWVVYFLRETIYNSNYEYMEYVGYGVIALGAIYLVWAEVVSLRERARSGSPKEAPPEPSGPVTESRRAEPN
jgi:ABC-type nickel/cobalt efflux system permease component RcnA